MSFPLPDIVTMLEYKDIQPNECSACESHVTQGDSRFNFGTGRSRALGPLPISCSNCLLTSETQRKESCDAPLWLQNNPAWCCLSGKETEFTIWAKAQIHQARFMASRKANANAVHKIRMKCLHIYLAYTIFRLIKVCVLMHSGQHSIWMYLHGEKQQALIVNFEWVCAQCSV